MRYFAACVLLCALTACGAQRTTGVIHDDATTDTSAHASSSPSSPSSPSPASSPVSALPPHWDTPTTVDAAPPTPFLAKHMVGNVVGFGVNGNAVILTGLNMAVPNTTLCGEPLAEVEAGLDELVQTAHINAVRMWFMQSAGGPANWANFDAAIAAAKSRGIKIIATLTNEWGNCEPQINGQYNYKQLAWYQGGYKTTGDGYPLAYSDFASAVAQHYANEPTIAMWQLVNEAEARDPADGSCPDENASATAIRAFADDMAQRLHAVDPNHMVNLGTIDDDRCGTTGADWQKVHAGNIDVCEVHSYDAPNDAMPPVITQRIAQCQALGKPIFAGEVGICSNVQADGSCSGGSNASTLAQRATFMQSKYMSSYQAGLSGMLVWEWDPWTPDTDTFAVSHGDPIEAAISKVTM